MGRKGTQRLLSVPEGGCGHVCGKKEGATAAKVEGRVLAGQQPSVEIGVDTESMAEGDWARPSKGQRGISPSLAEPRDPHF